MLVVEEIQFLDDVICHHDLRSYFEKIGEESDLPMDLGLWQEYSDPDF